MQTIITKETHLQRIHRNWCVHYNIFPHRRRRHFHLNCNWNKCYCCRCVRAMCSRTFGVWPSVYSRAGTRPMSLILWIDRVARMPLAQWQHLVHCCHHLCYCCHPWDWRPTTIVACRCYSQCALNRSWNALYWLTVVWLQFVLCLSVSCDHFRRSVRVCNSEIFINELSLRPSKKIAIRNKPSLHTIVTLSILWLASGCAIRRRCWIIPSIGLRCRTVGWQDGASVVLSECQKTFVQFAQYIVFLELTYRIRTVILWIHQTNRHLNRQHNFRKNAKFFSNSRSTFRGSSNGSRYFCLFESVIIRCTWRTSSTKTTSLSSSASTYNKMAINSGYSANAMHSY